MARKHDPTGRSKKGGNWVPVPHAMARSDAWRSLNASSIKLYIELRSRFNGGNNGKLSLSCQDAANLLALGKTTVQRAYAELEEKRFIVKVKAGQWYGRKATEWAVTDRPLDGHPATNAWQQWRYPKTDPRYSGGTMRAVVTRNSTGGG